VKRLWKKSFLLQTVFLPKNLAKKIKGLKIV
jgi:hypothetical protein